MGVCFGFSYLSNMGLHIYMYVIKVVSLMLTNFLFLNNFCVGYFNKKIGPHK